MINLIGWIGNIFFLMGAIFLAKKWIGGWHCQIIGNTCYVAFLQAVTLDHAKKLLAQDLPLLETSLELGLSGPGRLHDLFVTHEAMSPGIYKAKGEGLEITYGFHDCQFGRS